MQFRAILLSLIAVVPLGACVGTVGGSTPAGADAAPAGSPDAAPVASIAVTGTTMDYFGADPLPASTYATEGMTPALHGTTGADGGFTLDNVPPASSFYVTVSRTTGYRVTRNDAITIKDVSLQANLYGVSSVDAQRQYATLGLAPTTGTAILIADLRRNNGTPLEGVAVADISLVDSAGAPVPGIKGPYFFGPNGDLVSIATVPTSTAYAGKARMGYLDVPPGAWTLNVKYIGGTGGGAGGGGNGGGGGGAGGTPTPMTMVVPATTVAEGATLVSTGHQDNDAVPPTTGAITFTANIYPMLQKAAAGGQGCANCHNGITKAGGLAFDGPAADTYALIMGTAGVVSVAKPADSLLLMKPLYEDPPNHPNATWLTVADPAYMQVMAWITAGAPQ